MGGLFLSWKTAQFVDLQHEKLSESLPATCVFLAFAFPFQAFPLPAADEGWHGGIAVFCFCKKINNIVVTCPAICQCEIQRYRTTVKGSQTGCSNTANCATFDLDPFGIHWQCLVWRCWHAMNGFHAVYLYTVFSPSAWTMMSSWTGINPTSKPQQKERRGLHENNVSPHIWLHLPHMHSFFNHQKCNRTCVFAYFIIALQLQK